ncbi:MAG: GNAT family N-acetyltransferase [Planctomycetota bacterium]|jgi:GNAT superfamily N-acetyltransferase
MIEIFPAETGEDIELVKGLLEDYVASWFEFDGPVHEKEVEKARGQMENLFNHFGPPSGCLLLARYGEEVAGCVALEKLNDSVCQMKRLYVKPEFRGLKIGRELAERVIEQARRIGYERMRIHTVTALERANRLYKSLGFNEIDPYEYTPREDAVFMELELV